MSRSWAYWGLWLFLSLVFGVFYAFLYSVLLGIRDNYYRYAQKERLQWTGPGRRTSSPRPALWKLLLAALGSAWLVVHFVIFN